MYFSHFMKKQLLLGLSLIIMGTTGYTAYESIDKSIEAEKELRKNSEYVIYKNLDKASSEFLSAIHNLTYSPSEVNVSTDADGNVQTDVTPEDCPEPTFAKQKIKNARVEMNKCFVMESNGRNLPIDFELRNYGKIGMSSLEVSRKKLEYLAERLNYINEGAIKVDNTLPFSIDLCYYNGNNVDNYTFAKQRDQLHNLADEVDTIAEEYRAELPKELLDNKRNNVIFSILSVMGFFAGLGFGYYSLTKRDYDY